ncbi:MAG TPA: MDR family MFS transporter [Acidimicrobiales bacterium]
MSNEASGVDLLAPDSPPELHGRKLILVFIGLMLVMLMAALDATIVATALPTIAGDLGGLDHISWVATAYLLAETVVTPLYGKLGDQYGRRIVLLAGLGIFIVGSALCGLSQNFDELIAFRAVQGLGGGGLMVSAQTAIGDVVSPRERGRYQGLFGGVFGVATVIGPLVGGALTTSLSWRWIFYINLPIGIAAVIVLWLTFPKLRAKVHHSIDYLGTVMLSVGLAALVLMITFGGTTFPWASAEVIGLAVASVVALVVFFLVERRAKEPVLPPRLFSNSVFTSSGVVALFLGFAMFGAITFLPLYFQVVRGASPTESGLQLLPLMAGLIITSAVGGMIVTKTGRYRIFPIVGTAVTTLGLFLLSLLTPETSSLEAYLYMFVAGCGIGLVMQVLVVAVQNAVGYEDLGVATSGNTLFRNIGSSIGTAIVGTIFATTLASNLAKAFPGPAASRLSHSGHSLSTSTLNALPPQVHTTVLAAYSGAITTAFRVAAFISIAAFVASWFIKQLPMKTTLAATDIGETFGAPRAPDSLAEIGRVLSVLVGRQRMEEYLGRVIREAGIDIPLTDAGVLVLLRAQPTMDGPALVELAKARGVSSERAGAAIADSIARDLVTPDLQLTPVGADVADQLTVAVRQHLEEMLQAWSPEQYPDIVKLLDQFASEIVRDEGTKSAIKA